MCRHPEGRIGTKPVQIGSEGTTEKQVTTDIHITAGTFYDKETRIGAKSNNDGE